MFSYKVSESFVLFESRIQFNLIYQFGAPPASKKYNSLQSGQKWPPCYINPCTSLNVSAICSWNQLDFTIKSALAWILNICEWAINNLGAYGPLLNIYFSVINFKHRFLIFTLTMDSFNTFLFLFSRYRGNAKKTCP